VTTKRDKLQHRSIRYQDSCKIYCDGEKILIRMKRSSGVVEGVQPRGS
jgi:hypothetical protein